VSEEKKGEDIVSKSRDGLAAKRVLAHVEGQRLGPLSMMLP
jgi:hypothetical protein